MMLNRLLAAFALTLAAPVAAEGPATLTVTFTVTDAPTGQIMLSLYDNEAAHDRGGKPVAQAAVPVASGPNGATAVATFPGLAPGRYAIKAFHDVDGDGKMGMTPFGMPTEPFAFSNNAPAMAGPAPWSASSFAVDGQAATTAITIR